MKNISTDMWRQSPVYMKYIQTDDDSRYIDYTRNVEPLQIIICNFFTDAYIERMRIKSIIPIIFKKDLIITEHTII